MDLELERQNILERLKNVNEQLTEENIKNATKKEVIEYLMLVDQLKATLITLSEKE